MYIPRINWLLMVAVLYLVFAFKSSSALAAAYGVAVTGTMVITSIMAFFVMWKCWQWKVASAGLVIAPFLAVDLTFLLANLLKVFEGGWMPLAVGASLMLLMLTWRQGTRILAEVSKKDEVRLADFVTMIAKSSIARASGTAVFLTGNPDATPTALLHNIKHNKVVHENNIILKVIAEDVPRVYHSGSAVRYLHECHHAFWIYGESKRPNGLGSLSGLWPQVRRDEYIFLSVPTCTAACQNI
jgi:KUP system potassium uptake protein